jgi:hypothetical protein
MPYISYWPAKTAFGVLLGREVTQLAGSRSPFFLAFLVCILFDVHLGGFLSDGRQKINVNVNHDFGCKIPRPKNP